MSNIPVANSRLRFLRIALHPEILDIYWHRCYAVPWLEYYVHMDM